MRFSRNSLDRLEEIKNFPNDELESINEKSFDELTNKPNNPESKKPYKISPAEARAMDPWDSKPGKKFPGPFVYGVTHRDANMLITFPRNADEEFEMESRKGPMIERGKPTKSVVVNAK